MGPHDTPQTGIGWGLLIHRYHDPKDWPRQLERVPAELRQEAEDYLRGIAARMRAVLRIKGKSNA